ncbi:AEC family transporter [Leptospira idonii]|uniref:Permease n=1 Tax=Leptospira idonii TaxID=1193500 RepID=A0A4R9M1B0_9LEPT|nr:AEC family transporter [Leptospira idonii]TGN20483.1 permease [Leptospira idonii]
MSNLILLGVCFLSGMLFRRSGRFPENTTQVLNAFILHVSLPALVLYHIHEVKITEEILLPALMPWVLFFLAFSFFYLLYKFKKIEFKTAVCLTLTAGLGNTSFVGIPLLDAYLGKSSLGYGIVADQLGTFLTLSFPGIMLASVAEHGSWQFKPLLKRVIGFVPVQALLLAFLLRPFEYPEWTKTVLLRLGDTLTPLALVSVGYLLNLRTLKGHKNTLLLGLGMKLVILPLLIYYIFRPFTSDPLMFEAIVLEAAMAPMVTSAIIAIERNLIPHLAGLMLGLGIPISFGTTYLFLTVMRGGFL